MNVIAIIQARTGATRLPGKVLEDVAGQPMLARVVNRTRRAKSLSSTIVATTTETSDDVIANLCQTHGWPIFRGSEYDVLDRYYNAAAAFKADVIVRVTADCPLIEPSIIEKMISQFISHYPEIDYLSNNRQRSFPLGLDAEVIHFNALKKAWTEDHDPVTREHVTPFIWQQPKRFRIRNLANHTDFSYMRWTVDTIEDLTFVRKIYDHFGNDIFTWQEVLHLLETHPEWIDINRHIQQKFAP